MPVSFNEFNSFYEEIRQIVKEEVQEEIRLSEGFFDSAKGLFGGGSSHAFQDKKPAQTSQNKLGQAQQDAKIAAEFRTFQNKNPQAKMTLDQYKKVRDQIKKKEWEEAKQNMSNIQSIADREAGRSARSKNADDRRSDLALAR